MMDIVGAVRSAMLGDAAITALVGTRIFVNRLERAFIEGEDTYRPSKTIVLRQAGGAGRADRQKLDTPTLSVLCYGETDLEADKVRRAVWDFARVLERSTVSGVLIHHMVPTGGAVPSVDPEIVWPIIAQSYSVLACA